MMVNKMNWEKYKWLKNRKYSISLVTNPIKRR